jgi:hypothetical protein
MQEQHKVRRAFGYIYDYGEYPAGHVFDDEFIHNGVLSLTSEKVPYYWLFLDGEISFTPKTPGGNVLKTSYGVTVHDLAFSAGDYVVTTEVPTRLLCFSSQTNKGVTPDIPRCERIVIAAGEEYHPPIDSKLLFADGLAQAKGIDIAPLTCVKITTTTTVVRAVTKTAVLRFLD